jgi:hypothetical protein
MYLLAVRPNMLSNVVGDEGYQRTLRVLRGRLKYRGRDDEGYQRTLLELRNSESRGYDDIEFQIRWKTEKSVFRGGEKLARRQLLLLEPEKRREMIKEVWVEMVAYAAAHCPWKEHTHQLRRGGELLTHVSLLMLHLGLSEQYEYNETDNYRALRGVSVPKILLKYVDRYCMSLGVRIK